MPDQIYVIGHVNPDTDAIASAMGYAWLLRARDGANTIAARAGALNPQTSWVLKNLSLDAPVLLTDASPRFESVMTRLDTIRPESQLGAAWTLASKKRGLDFAVLLITDVVRGTSRLILSSSAPPVLDDLPYPPLPDGTREAQGVVSRKKQLLPVILGLLER